MAQSPAKPKAAVPTLLRVVGGGLLVHPTVGRGILDAPNPRPIRGRQGCRPLRRWWSAGRRGQAPALRGGTYRPGRQWSVRTGGGTHRSRPTFYVGSLFVAVGRGILDAPNPRSIRGRQGCRPLRRWWSAVRHGGGGKPPPYTAEPIGLWKMAAACRRRHTQVPPYKPCRQSVCVRRGRCPHRPGGTIGQIMRHLGESAPAAAHTGAALRSLLVVRPCLRAGRPRR